MRKNIPYFLSLLLFLILCQLPAEAFAADSEQRDALVSRIDKILRQAAPSRAKWGIAIVSLDSGETVYARNPDDLMIPASNMKILTTASALYYLGPEFSVRTSVYFDDTPDKTGVLQGNIILYGRGDPNISGRFTYAPTTIFEQMAIALKAKGLRVVEGDVVGDDSYFDSEYFGPWLPTEAHKWYAARVSALSFNDNCIDLYVYPGKTPGSKAKVIVSPQTSHARIVNRTSTTTNRNNSVWASPTRNPMTILVAGKIWAQREVQELWYPVESPPLYAATVFKEVLEGSGITVKGRARALGDEHLPEVPEDAIPVLEHESLPLCDMAKVVNKRSQNLHAELLFKQVGLHARYDPTFEGGTRAVTDFALAAGVDPESIVVMDGSGLSRSNRASARSIVRILQFVEESEWCKVFRESLAIAGIDKSLKSMKWSVPRGKVQAKTGSLKKVLALSGYADGKSERFAFSIIANDYRGDSQRIRRARDGICAELVRY